MPTLKQFAITQFFKTLDAYKTALKEKNQFAIVITSVQIHAAKANVPKRYWPLVNRAYRECTAS